MKVGDRVKFLGYKGYHGAPWGVLSAGSEGVLIDIRENVPWAHEVLFDGYEEPFPCGSYELEIVQ